MFFSVPTFVSDLVNVGWPVAAPALVRDVWKAESGVAGQWSLEHGPYVLGGLAPGRYSARVGAPGHPVSAVLDVDVEEGAVARVQFKLARRP